MKKELLASLSPQQRYMYEEEQMKKARKFTRTMDQKQKESAEYLKVHANKVKQDSMKKDMEYRREMLKKQELEKHSKDKIVDLSDKASLF